MALRAVLFDFGGTLFSYRDFGRHTFELIVEGARRLGVEAEPHAAVSAYRAASEDAFREFFPEPYYLHRDLFHETFRRFARQLGGEADAAYLDWFHAAMRQLVLERFELRPDCRETLEGLRAAGLHVGIVSNIDDDYLEPMLERTALHSCLDSWLSSERARSCKPHAAIFEQALARAGAAPGQALFVGDSPEHDVAGARALGLRTALLREAGTTPPGAGAGTAGEPHHEIERLEEVLDLALR
jgi:HAD superfamily hydrolase (TIGR01509 family)